MVGCGGAWGLVVCDDVARGLGRALFTVEDVLHLLSNAKLLGGGNVDCDNDHDGILVECVDEAPELRR